MKRDWEIIREILIKLEELEPNKGYLQLNDFPPEKAYEYSYHVALLIESGFIKGEITKTIGNTPNSFLIYGLTWNGYELLNTIKSPKLWDDIKQYFKKHGLTMTVDFIKLIAQKIIEGY